MVAACIIRRKQLLNLGLPDPFLGISGAKGMNGVSVGDKMQKLCALFMLTAILKHVDESTSPLSPKSQAAVTLEKANADQEMQKALLRLTFIMQQSTNIQYIFVHVLLVNFSSSTDIQQTTNLKPQSAIEVLLFQPSLLDSLSRAVRGNYSIILSLLGCLDHGTFVKRLVDVVIDSCEFYYLLRRGLHTRILRPGDHVVNLREVVLDHRIKYSITTTDDKRRRDSLVRAGKALEK